MDNKEIISKWLERSEYDLSAAEAMLKSSHFLYVAFMCQQASEKILKALWCSSKQDSPPYTHNLATLAESLQLKLTLDHQEVLDRLNQYYIVGRYPSFKQKLAVDLNRSKAEELLSQTKEFVKWCKKSIKM